MTKKQKGKAELAPAIVNKHALRNYECLSSLEAGLVLKGSEVKSIRAGTVNLKESYVQIRNGEAFLVSCHISPYIHAPADAHEATREKKLLLSKKEIERLQIETKKSGLAIVPRKLYFNSKGRLKLEIFLGRGKKLFDKREDMKKKEAGREIERAMKKLG